MTETGDEGGVGPLLFRRLGSEASGWFLAQTGAGLDTTPYPRWLFVDPSAHRPTVDLLAGWSAVLGGTGSFVFVSRAAPSVTTLRQRFDAVRDRRPDWSLIWLHDDGHASGLSLAPVARKPGGLGAVVDDTGIGPTPNLGLRIEAGTRIEMDDNQADLMMAAATGTGLLGGDVEVIDGVRIDLRAGGLLGFRAQAPGGLAATVDLTVAPDLHRDFQGETKREVLSFPVFTTVAGVHDVVLDPADVEASEISLEAGSAMESGYRDTVGRPVELRVDDARLVARLVGVEVPGAEPEVALTPAGRFTGSGPGKVVAGLSGAEIIALGPSAVLEFHPDRPSTVSSGRLLADRRTAWVSFSGADLCSQPLAEGYHQPAADDGFRPWLEARTAALGPEDIVPLVPYGRFAGDPTVAARLEAEVIDPTRTRILTDAASPVMADDPAVATAVTAVTPGGFQARFVDGVMQSVELARVGASSLTLDTSGEDGRLLRSGLGSDGQFLVMSRLPPFLAVDDQPAGRLDLDGWPLDLAAGWDRHRTVLLIKQDRTRSIEDLVGDPPSWFVASSFNQRPQATAAQLRASMAAAAASTDPVIEDLHRRVLTDPGWRGVLILDGAVTAVDLPTDLAALAAGIGSGFAAHHLVIDQRPITSGDPATSSDSSLSALIVYRGRDRNRSGGFSFDVDLLRVEIAEARVATVDARIRVGLGTFLGSAPAGPAELRLRGYEQRRNGAAHYVFMAADQTRFPLRDAMLDSVEIGEAQLTTVTGADSVVTRFGLSGDVHLVAPPDGEPDLVGYRTMTFRNLGLVMTADRSAPTRPRFHWDTAAASVSGRPAAGSLPDEFPLTPRSLLSGGTGDASPAELGYQTIRLPTEDAPPAGTWVGIDASLALGTMGDLASDAVFEADLGLFWSPHPTRRRLALGLRFPGTDFGAFGFTVQDVLKLATHGIVLVDRGPAPTDPDSEPDPDHRRFRLRLEGMGLEILGVAVPWGGSFDLAITSGPGEAGLGWYGAYS